MSPETTLQEALEILRLACPRDMAIHGESIERNLVRRKPSAFKHKYEMKDFLRGPLPMPEKKALFLHGPSGVGKSHFALAHFNHPLFVSDMDDLKSLSPTYHDGIVFDDMSFTHIPPEKVIHLLDLEFTRSIRCRHTNATIPAFMPRIFTHNSVNPFYTYDGPMAATEEQANAINRRLSCWNIPLSLVSGGINGLVLCHEFIIRRNVEQRSETFHCDGQ